MIFEVEPFSPNIGPRNMWNIQNDRNEGHGNGAAKDTEMKEAQNNGGTVLPDASVGNAANNNSTVKEAKAPETQMDYYWSNDDLLGEEIELSESARNFLGVQKGEPVNVRNAATLATTGSVQALSAPAHMVHRIS